MISFYRFPDDESHNSDSKIRKLKKFIGLPLHTDVKQQIIIIIRIEQEDSENSSGSKFQMKLEVFRS